MSHIINSYHYPKTHSEFYITYGTQSWSCVMWPRRQRQCLSSDRGLFCGPQGGASEYQPSNICKAITNLCSAEPGIYFFILCCNSFFCCINIAFAFSQEEEQLGLVGNLQELLSVPCWICRPIKPSSAAPATLVSCLGFSVVWFESVSRYINSVVTVKFCPDGRI